MRETESLERKNLLLSLENALLRMERRLPPGAPGGNDGNLLE